MKTNFFDIALALRLARRANFSRQPFWRGFYSHSPVKTKPPYDEIQTYKRASVGARRFSSWLFLRMKSTASYFEQ